MPLRLEPILLARRHLKTRFLVDSWNHIFLEFGTTLLTELWRSRILNKLWSLPDFQDTLEAIFLRTLSPQIFQDTLEAQFLRTL